MFYSLNRSRVLDDTMKNMEGSGLCGAITTKLNTRKPYVYNSHIYYLKCAYVGVATRHNIIHCIMTISIDNIKFMSCFPTARNVPIYKIMVTSTSYQDHIIFTHIPCV